MSDINIQWHMGFVAAMYLELREDRDRLIFDKEHNLNTKPLQIDLLVIKKDFSDDIRNEIGEFYRKYNIIEYKSPDDQLNIDTYYKTVAYACLYKTYGETVNERKADDITISIIRERMPEGLFRYFKEDGIIVENPHKGIYRILDKMLFPTQIIVTEELSKEHTWLRALSGRMEEEDMRRLLTDASRLRGKMDREFADSVLEVSVKANKELVEKLMGDDVMSEALLGIMEPIILEREKKAKNEGIEQGIEQGIVYLVDAFRDLGHDDTEIVKVVMTKYGLTEEKARKYL